MCDPSEASLAKAGEFNRQEEAGYGDRRRLCFVFRSERHVRNVVRSNANQVLSCNQSCFECSVCVFQSECVYRTPCSRASYVTTTTHNKRQSLSELRSLKWGHRTLSLTRNIHLKSHCRTLVEQEQPSFSS